MAESQLDKVKVVGQEGRRPGTDEAGGRAAQQRRWPTAPQQAQEDAAHADSPGKKRSVTLRTAPAQGPFWNMVGKLVHVVRGGAPG